MEPKAGRLSLVLTAVSKIKNKNKKVDIKERVGQTNSEDS